MAPTVSVDAALVVVALSVRSVLFREAVTITPKGWVCAWSKTVPVKPPLPVTVMVEFFDVPWRIVKLPGLAEIMKSGGATTTKSMAW